jgi:aryl-alcohol dehydrogenase-like predicted oxidoreductase
MQYKIFGNTGLRVSELALGTMTFGTEWGWGSDKETSKAVFDKFANEGGNFIDTANHYTEGTSEKFLGDFIGSDRDHFVLATKYTLYDRKDDVNFAGNHRKNLFRSVEASLDRLQTEYIDILWLHAWDFVTPVEEVMRGLNDLISMGLVHYIGISDTPAWIVSQANTLAQFKNHVPFAGLQVEYSLLERTPEQDLLPMAEAFNMAITPWSPLAGGLLTGKYLNGKTGRLKEDDPRINERNNRIVKKVVQIASDISASPAQVALAWILAQPYQTIPIIGGSSESHIIDNINCLEIQLDENQLNELNEVSKTALNFPHNFLAKDGVKNRIYSEKKGQIKF